MMSSDKWSANFQSRRAFSPVNCIAYVSCLVMFATSQPIDMASTSSTADSPLRRCFCNEAACVANGYMCKSPGGVCVAQLSLDGDAVRSRYACADDLPSSSSSSTVDAGRLCSAAVGRAPRGGDTEVVFRTRRTGARAAEGGPADRRGGGDGVGGPAWTETTCCATDMCNYYFYRSTLPVTGGALNVSSSATASGQRGDSYVQFDNDRQTVDDVMCFRLSTALLSGLLVLLAAVLLTSVVICALRMLVITPRRRHRCYGQQNVVRDCCSSCCNHQLASVVPPADASKSTTRVKCKDVGQADERRLPDCKRTFLACVQERTRCRPQCCAGRCCRCDVAARHGPTHQRESCAAPCTRTSPTSAARRAATIIFDGGDKISAADDRLLRPTTAERGLTTAGDDAIQVTAEDGQFSRGSPVDRSSSGCSATSVCRLVDVVAA